MRILCDFVRSVGLGLGLYLGLGLGLWLGLGLGRTDRGDGAARREKFQYIFLLILYSVLN